MKKKILNTICLCLIFVTVGCGYRASGYTLSCDHPTKGTYNVYESAGLTKKEYKQIKEKYETMGYICQ